MTMDTPGQAESLCPWNVNNCPQQWKRGGGVYGTGGQRGRGGRMKELNWQVVAPGCHPK